MKKAQREKLLFYEVFGWYGMSAILLSYGLISFEIITPHSFAYQLLSASGSLGLIVHSIVRRDYQPLILNIIWFCIALFVIGTLIFSLH